MVNSEFKGVMISTTNVILDYLSAVGTLANSDGVAIIWSTDLVEDVDLLNSDGDVRLRNSLLEMYPAYFKVDDEGSMIATFDDSVMLYFFS